MKNENLFKYVNKILKIYNIYTTYNLLDNLKSLGGFK